MATVESKESGGTYVAVKFNELTLKHIAEYQTRNNIPNPVPSIDIHSTVVYSRVPIEWTTAEHLDIEVDTSDSIVEVWDTQNGSRCLVWHYYSAYQHRRFKEAMAKGATYDFPEYKCHITLSYDVGDFDERQLYKPAFNIVLDHEFVESLDD
jgi:hypothetical protein